MEDKKFHPVFLLLGHSRQDNNLEQDLLLEEPLIPLLNPDEVPVLFLHFSPMII